MIREETVPSAATCRVMWNARACWSKVDRCLDGCLCSTTAVHQPYPPHPVTIMMVGDHP
jgi:hypothetical protein